MIWDMVRGQDEPVEILKRSAAAGRLAHALLFVGPPGVGKALVARALATALLCERIDESQLEACGACGSCRMMLAGTHPDFLRISCPEDRSELPIELLVGSRENRGHEGLCHDLSFRPMVGRRRVAVIEDADRMSLESANALLKTLEEPPPYAVMVLIAGDSSSLLPTIRSRCQTLRFVPLSAATVADLVQELGWTESVEDAAAAAASSGGSLAVAQQLLNPQLRLVRSLLREGFGNSKFKPRSMAVATLAALDEIGGESQRQRAGAQWVVRFLVDFFQGALRQCCHANGTATQAGDLAEKDVTESARFLDQLPKDDQAGAEIIGEAIDRCCDAEQQLAGNASIPLCLEALFSDLASILSGANSAAARRPA